MSEPAGWSDLLLPVIVSVSSPAIGIRTLNRGSREEQTIAYFLQVRVPRIAIVGGILGLLGSAWLCL